MRKPLTLLVVSILAMLLSTWSQGEFAGNLIGGSEGMPQLAAFVFKLLGAAAGIGMVVGLFWAAWTWLMRTVTDETPASATSAPDRDASL